MQTRRPTAHGRPAPETRSRRCFPALVVGLLCLLLQPVPAHAQGVGGRGGQTGARPAGKAQPFPEEYTLEQVGAWGGEVGAFVKDGSIGYVGAGQRLVVLDMSNLNNLVEIASVRLGSVVRDVKLRDGYAYVITEGLRGGADDAGITASAFHVVEVHNPNDPQLVWSNPRESSLLFNDGEGVQFYGDFAFLQRVGGTFAIADISNPEEPIIPFHPTAGMVAFEHPNGSYLQAVNDWEIQGDYAFVAERSASLGYVHVYDLTTIDQSVLPLEPRLVASVPFFLNREVTGITVEGDWAYVSVLDRYAFGTNEPATELWAVDVSDPTSPVKMGEYNDFPQPRPEDPRDLGELSVSSGRLYVSNDSGTNPNPLRDSLMIFDVATDPGQPALIGSYRTHGSVHGVVGGGNIAYLMDHGEGLIAMDTTAPGAPSRLGNFHSPATLGVMCKQGDLMYISDYWNGMTILDVSDQADPQVVGVYQTQPNRAQSKGLAIDNDGYAYLAVGNSGIDVIDISDPATPTLAGQFLLSPSWRAHAVIVDDSTSMKTAYLYATPPSGCAQILSLDVTEPAAISQLDAACTGSTEPAYFVAGAERGVYYHSSLLLVSGVLTSIVRLDATDPSQLAVSPLEGSRMDGANDLPTALAFDPQEQTCWVTISSGNLNLPDSLSAIEVSDDGGGDRVSSTGFALAGAVTMHPQGLILTANASDFLGEPMNRVLLLDVGDPTDPQPLASAVLPFLASAGIGLLSTHALGDETGIYITRSFTLGERSNTGLAIFGLRSTIDRDGDGRINSRDLSHFIGEMREKSPEADLNRDGRTDREDVLVFVRMYAI